MAKKAAKKAPKKAAPKKAAPKPKSEPELEIGTLFGTKPERALLVVAQPEPDYDWLGDTPAEEAAPSAPQSDLLQVDGDGARFKERVPFVLLGSWQSSSGAAYFSTPTGAVMIYEGGSFRSEQVAGVEDALEFVYGLSGKTPADDVVVVSGAFQPTLTMRRAGSWKACKVPDEVNIINAIGGHSADRLYATTDVGLLTFNASTAELLDAPDDEELTGLYVAKSGDIYVTGDRKLFVWSERKQAWSAHKAPAELTVGITEYGGKILLATFKGIFAWDGKAFSPVLEKFACNIFVAIGSELFALGMDGGLACTRSGEWRRLLLPRSLLAGHA